MGKSTHRRHRDGKKYPSISENLKSYLTLSVRYDFRSDFRWGVGKSRPIAISDGICMRISSLYTISDDLGVYNIINNSYCRDLGIISGIFDASLYEL